MSPKAEEILNRCLRTVLTPLSTGDSIEESDGFSPFQVALTRVVPNTLAEVYDYWRYEGLDGFRFAVARKLGPEEAEFVGLCLLVGSQAWIPLHFRLRIAPESDHIDWLDCKVGDLGNGGAFGWNTVWFNSRNEVTLLGGESTGVYSVVVSDHPRVAPECRLTIKARCTLLKKSTQ